MLVERNLMRIKQLILIFLLTQILNQRLKSFLIIQKLKRKLLI